VASWLSLRINMGKHATLFGSSNAGAIFNQSRQHAQYWKYKRQDAHYHQSTWGGARNIKYKGVVRQFIISVIWEQCKNNPEMRISEYQNILHRYLPKYYVPSRTWISQLFKSWGWSFKVPDMRAQLNKYTTNNIRYYMDFLATIQDIPPSKMKFCDEAHFSSRNLYRKKALGPKNKRVRTNLKTDLASMYSVTITTSLDPNSEPILMDVRKESNNQFDFMLHVLWLIDRGSLVNGDWFFCDNAKIHLASDTIQFLSNTLKQAGVRLIFLPTYSPELNPCELVFGFVKNWLRNHREGGKFWEEMMVAFALVDHTIVEKWYSHCLNVERMV